MKRFRFMKVREVKCGWRGKEGDGGLDLYIGEELSVEDLVKGNGELILDCEIGEGGKVRVEYNWNKEVEVI